MILPAMVISGSALVSVVLDLPTNGAAVAERSLQSQDMYPGRLPS